MSASMNWQRHAERLNALRLELSDRLARLERDTQRSQGALSPDFSEQAVERENDEVVDRLREATHRDLGAVTAAIARIADHSYGLCLSCAAPIEERRLDVLPATATCVRCETRSSASQR